MTESAGAMLSMSPEQAWPQESILGISPQGRSSAMGDSYDFSPDLGFDHYRRRCNLLLGHRQVRHRPPTCKSAEAARNTDLPRRHFATRAAGDGNLLGRALSAPADRCQQMQGHHVGIGWQRVCSDETAVVHIRTAETAREHRANQGEAVRLTDLGYEPWLEHAFGREVRIQQAAGDLSVQHWYTTPPSDHIPLGGVVLCTIRSQGRPAN
jgi:hypothetical protein